MPAKIAFAYPRGRQDAAVDFSARDCYRSLVASPFAGGKDLGASFTLSWERDALHLTVEVRDDVFHQGEAGKDGWRGDSVQVAFQNLAQTADSTLMSEYSLALSARGPSVYRHFSQTRQMKGDCSNVSLEVRREGNLTLYQARFPLAELGFQSLDPERVFGFSLLVNDNDGQERKGYLHWGDGIGVNKNPAEYNWMVLKNRPEQKTE